MTDLRPCQLSDFAIVASWIKSEVECRLWCGTRVSYPIDVATLPDALGYTACDSWTLTVNRDVAAFGQLLPRPAGRLHLARLIAAPDRRGEGLGRLIAAHMLERALAQEPAVVSLNVLTQNKPALALYESLGFVPATRPPEEPQIPSMYMVYSLNT